MNTTFQESIYDQIKRNRYRTIYLFIAFPIIIIGTIYLAGLIVGLLPLLTDGPWYAPFVVAYMMLGKVGIWIFIEILICSLISYLLGSKMILTFAGAKPIEKKDHPELFRSVENVSIAAGLPKTPEIYIIEDPSLNAFTTGSSPKNAKIAVSRGLLEKLSKPELEAVMAHEVGHIINSDIRLMLISITLVGSIKFIGELLVKSSETKSYSKKEKGNLFGMVTGMLLTTIGSYFATLTKLAISREREFLADATSATLTHNPRALASALEKISSDARLEVLDKKVSLTTLCIADPSEKGHHLNNAPSQLEPTPTSSPRSSHLWSTHPPMSERIEKLQRY